MRKALLDTRPISPRTRHSSVLPVDLPNPEPLLPPCYCLAQDTRSSTIPSLSSDLPDIETFLLRRYRVAKPPNVPPSPVAAQRVSRRVLEESDGTEESVSVSIGETDRSGELDSDNDLAGFVVPDDVEDKDNSEERDGSEDGRFGG